MDGWICYQIRSHGNSIQHMIDACNSCEILDTKETTHAHQHKKRPGLNIIKNISLEETRIARLIREIYQEQTLEQSFLGILKETRIRPRSEVLQLPDGANFSTVQRKPASQSSQQRSAGIGEELRQSLWSGLPGRAANKEENSSAGTSRWQRHVISTNSNFSF